MLDDVVTKQLEDQKTSNLEPESKGGQNSLERLRESIKQQMNELKESAD